MADSYSSHDRNDHPLADSEEPLPASISRATSQPTLRGIESLATLRGVESWPTLRGIESQPTLRGVESFSQLEPLEEYEQSSVGHSPTASTWIHVPRPRQDSSVSYADEEFFDRDGIRKFRPTMTTQEENKIEKNRLSLTLTLPVDEPFNFEKTIRRTIRKQEEARIKTRTLGVAFKDLRVVGRGVSHSYLPTLGSIFSPPVILENIQTFRHPQLRDIISGFEGVVKAGEMLLVLGSPGAGCSTLLKTLSNHRREYHAVEGNVYYDSILPNELHDHFRGDVQYCPEDDIHFPSLTVQQTIGFAAKARTPQARAGKSRKEFSSMVTSILTTIFGLEHALHTPVGDAAIRGVSGGEKKRVSIAESMAARPCIGIWDNSTRGLDASTAVEFVRALRTATDAAERTTVVTLYQAGESLYAYFDKVCVIYEGQMAYFGPASQARQYFIDMGYEPANRQTTADFLVAVTDPSGRIQRDGYSNLPHTAAEFAKYFRNSDLGQGNSAEYDAYVSKFVDKPEKKSAYIESAHAEFSKYGRKSSPYLMNIPQQAAIVMLRRVQIIIGNPTATILQLVAYIFQAIIIGTVFFKLPATTGAFFSRGGALFFALLFPALTSMAEIPALHAQRPIIHRHETAALYHPFVEALALTLVDIPITSVTSTIFTLLVYFMVGLQKSADQYLIFLLFVILITLVMKAWFRTLAAAFKSPANAQSFAGISVLALVIYTGYTIPKPTMIGALRWITYINPLKYGFEVILTNEFRTLKGSCSNLVPQGPGYKNVSLVNQVCTTVGSAPGQHFVDGNRFMALSYDFSFSRAWINLGIDLAFGIAFVSTLLLFTEWNTSSLLDTPVTLFKRRSRSKPITQVSNSEGKTRSGEPVIEDDPHSYPPVSLPPSKRMVDIFSWKNINYVVPIPGKSDKSLLSDVSGYVAPGKLTALMGESGAGKTTLLNVLAMRTDTGVVTGDRFVNGQALPADFQSQSGYCQQMDTHAPFATVREALLFSAKLRQPGTVSLAEKEAYVDECLRMCGLEAYADASVGSLSIEHRKRTTIGVELAAKPKLLLFLDEPTSGLDSKSAWAIVSFLRTLANNGQAILCTIHQPSAELFQVFDRILLLRKGGETVYFGDIGHNATSLISYFERNGARKCLVHENPAEYMLDVIGAGATATSAVNWYDIWNSAPESKHLQEELENIHIEGRNRPAVAAAIHSEFAAPWSYQTWELVKRDSEAHWRDPSYLVAKIILNGFGGLFIGFTFFQAADSQQGTQNKLFAIFMATVLSVPLSNQIQVPFINMRNIYEIRERPSRMYSWTALVASQLIVAVPWSIAGSIVLFFSWYWTVGFETSRAGYTFLTIVLAFPCYYTTFSQAVAAMTPTAEIASVIFSFLFSFVLTFTGVLQPYTQLGWWKWMYRLSPYTYLIEGLLGQALGKQTINCSSIEFVTIDPPTGQTCAAYMGPYIASAGGYLMNASASSACQFCSIRTTDQFLAGSFNITYEHHWRDLGIFWAFTGLNIFLVFSLTYLFRVRKGSLFPSLRRGKSN